MKNQIWIAVFYLTLISCQLGTAEQRELHPDLLGFKTMIVAESVDQNYERLSAKVDRGELETKYLNDVIYVSYYDELNACGSYGGNLDLRGDSIRLVVGLISDEVCTSTSIYRVTFLIDNPGQENRIIAR